MRKVLLLGAISILAISSCTSNNNDKLKLLETASANFEKSQKERWDGVKNYLEKNPGVTDSLFGNKNFAGYNQKDFLTGPMDSAFAHWYIRNYKESQKPTIDVNGKEVPVTESIWIDRNAILEFAKTILDGQDDIDGIRVYFAKYPPEFECSIDPNLRTTAALVHDRNTVVMVATKNGGTDIHSDYFEPMGTSSRGLYIYDYNSLCPTVCQRATLGDH